MRKNAGKLKDTPFGISQQFPREIMETRKRLVPIMKEARQRGQDAYVVTLDVDVKLRNLRPVVFTSYTCLDKVNFILFLLTF